MPLKISVIKLPETESVKELRKSMNELLMAFNSPEAYLIGNCFYIIYCYIRLLIVSLPNNFRFS